MFLSFLGLDVGLKSWDDVGTASVSVLGVVFLIACVEAAPLAIAATGEKLASELERERLRDSESVREPGYDLSAPSAQGELQLTGEVRMLAATMLADLSKPPGGPGASSRKTLIQLLLQPWEVKGDEAKLSIPPDLAGSG